MQRLCEYGGAEGTQAILKYIFLSATFLCFLCVFFFVVIPGLNELGIQCCPHSLALVVLGFTSKIII
jgi:hypothetical protein